MELSAAALTTLERYKILTGLVFPRPIALVSTRSENGVANCAPYSWFNAVCEEPPLVVISFGARKDSTMKHSLINILRTGEFVVNLVDEDIANSMHISSDEVAESVSEFDTAGFSEAPCSVVKHPRIAQAPVSFECKLYKRVEIGHMRDIILGEVVQIHARDGLIDPVSKRVAEDQYWPVGRLYGTRYCTTRQRFELPGEIPE
jgi:flavin reductase (DIM6/NTAB) family NADH-FMN oxidoreductase RutF